MKHSRRNAGMILTACVASIMLMSLAPQASGVSLSAATRTLQAYYTPSIPSPVQVLVNPALSVSSWTLVETLPADCTGSAISDGGVWDATNHMISWGPFLDATSHSLTYQATFPTGSSGIKTFSGTVTFNSAAQAVTGNTTIALDPTPPWVLAVTCLDANPTSLSTVRYQVVFSEPVTSVTLAQFSLTRGGSIGGASLTAVADGPTTWTVTARTTTGNGTLRLDVKGNGSSGIMDFAGNFMPSPFASGVPYTIDRVAPQATLSTKVSYETNVTTIPVAVTFNEPVHGFDASDIITTNALVTDFGTSTSALYHFNLIPLAEGPLQAGIGAAAARDAAGNPNALKRLNLVYDKTPPVFTAPVATPPQAALHTAVTMTFSASEVLSSAPAVTVNGHAATIQSQNGLIYNFAYTISAIDPEGPAQIDISGNDPAGNHGATSSTTALLIDTASPTGTVAINNGAPMTTSTAVLLRLLANDHGGSGVSQVNLSNDGVDWSGWSTLSSPLPWTLAGGDGVKRTFAQFRDIAGNISSVTSDTIVLDTTPPLFSNFVVSPALAPTLGTVVTTTFTVSEALQSSPTLKINGHNANLHNHRGLQYGFAYVVALGDPDGWATLTASGRDRAGNRGATSATTALMVDTAAPMGTIIINNGTDAISTTSVFLTLTADGGTGTPVMQMSFSNSGAVWSDWEPFAAFRNWTITSGDGLKTVYVRFMDGAGHVSGQNNDTIELDTQPPQSQVTAPNGVTSNSLLTVQWTAADIRSGTFGLKNVEVLWSKGSGPWTSLGTYTPDVTSVPFDTATHGGPGTYLFFSIATDKAGNVESWPAGADVTVTVDKTAPTGSLTINNGTAYTSTTAATLTLNATDAGGSGLAQLSLSNDGTTWSNWQAYATIMPWTLAAGEGTRTVYARFRDGAGNISATRSDSIVLDAHAPQSQVTAPSGLITSSVLTLKWTAQDSGAPAAGVRSVQIYWVKDSGSWAALGSFAAGVTKTTFDTAAHGGFGTYLFFAVATDRAGNVETWPAAADVTVKAVPNISPVLLYLLGYTSDPTGLDRNADAKIDISDELARLKAAKGAK